MKKILQTITTVILFIQVTFAQTGNVGIGTASPDASAILDVNSSTKGLLIPSVALTATNSAGPITSPATSLLVYNTATAGTAPNNVTPGYYFNSGTSASPIWVRLLNQSTGWQTVGNTGTTTTSYADNAAQTNNFLGTTDNEDVEIYTNSSSNNAKSDIKLYTSTSTGNAITTPSDILHIRRNGTSGVNYPQVMSFALGKYNTGLSSRTELDINLGNGNTFTPDVTVMTLRGNGNVGISSSNIDNTLDIGGSIGVESDNVVEFGDDVAGKEANAGKIGYQKFTTGALDIVGAGTTSGTRIVKIFDNIVANNNVIASDGIVSGKIQIKQGPGTGADNQWHTIYLDANYGASGLSAYCSGSYLDGDIKMQGIDITGLLTTTNTWYASNNTGANSSSTTVNASAGTSCDNCTHSCNCPDGSIATGWQVYATGNLDYYLKLRCTTIASGYTTVESGYGVESVYNFPNANIDDITHIGVCPTGTFIKGLSIYAAAQLDNKLRVFCTGIKKN